MADAGIGEAMLISAAIGAGTGAAGSAISGGDPMKGALTGALMGGVTGGIGAGFGAVGNGLTGAEVAAEAVPTVTGATTVGSSAAQGLDQASLDFIKNNPQLYPTAANGSLATSVTSPYTPPIPNIEAAAVAPSGQGINTIPTTNAANSFTANPSSTPQAPASKGLFGYEGKTPNVFQYGPQSNMALAGIGATSGISAAMQAERDKYRVPETEHYTGPLSRFKYDPSTYNPDVVRPPNPPYKPVYAAEGGIMSLANNGYAMGGPAPQTNFANPSQSMMGTSQYSMATDPMSGNIAQRNMASGGITSLGSYSDGGRLLKGPGDGMSDNIPAMIGSKQEARLADGEFVIPADVVSHLGNGSTDAGAKTLYSMMNKVRKARTGTKKQGRQIEASSYLPA